jgi:cellulose synthase/poly-beta-1,6-N-acetylglucosamine synthase-like glycosyltransferase
MDLLSWVLLLLSVVVLAQALFALYLTLYTWEKPERLAASHGPASFDPSDVSFTVLIPARNEARVIYDTVMRIWYGEYPLRREGESYREWYVRKRKSLEIAVICFEGDVRTIAEAKRAAFNIGSDSVRVVTFAGEPLNKPHALNVGLASTSNDVVVVFDAEDDVHSDLLASVSTVIEREYVEIVQGGVQLMNMRDHWFALHNCLEYYFWFKSRLHFHARHGMIPLGGNTVFVRRELLDLVGGWDEGCLTEDADIGVRLSALGAPVRVVYDAHLVTREETPATTAAFLRQRTRWHQGFLQVLRKGDWLRLPTWRQRLLAFYTFSYPALQVPLMALWPVAILGGLLLSTPIVVAMVTYAPMYVLFLQFLATLVGARLFTREYGLRLPLRTFALLVVTFIPYQWLLGLASARAVYRELEIREDWEKTAHVGAHRVRQGARG